MKSLMLKIVMLITLLAGSISMANAVSLDSQWYAYRYNSGGSSLVILPPHANHFCYLSSVSFTDIDTGGEVGRCEVRRQGTVWVLDAYMGTSSDADVYCKAYCYNN